ncbi:hypothetical protein FPV67DRAFT_1495041 [Lyophyllum atratum]|nr:hypothetical protein FPV67DRAFT_1495041 [Lyophyllum atratum]
MTSSVLRHGSPVDLESSLDLVEDQVAPQVAQAEMPLLIQEADVNHPTCTSRGLSFTQEEDKPGVVAAPSLPEELRETTLQRGGSPALFDGRVHGGRSTPVPSRYQYQPSTTGSESSSYLTGTDREGNIPWHGAQSYVAVDPYLPSVAQSLVNFTYPGANGQIPSHPHSRPSTPMPPPPYQSTTGDTLFPSTSNYILAFLFDTLPRQIYLHFLLTLPSLYFSRVARIFEDAELSMPDIKKMAVVSAKQWKEGSTTMVHAQWNFEPSIVSPHFSNLKSSWEHFIDSLIKEWKTLNIISALLLSAILTTLQIDGAITDPITRNTGLLSLVCGLMSILYGCLYILRFNTMRKVHKAAEWAEEAQQTKTLIWWNVWVLLAMPSIWLSWSIIFYLACVMSFVWRTGTTHDPVLQVTPLVAFGPRIAITFVFLLGIVYLSLIVSTFRRYGAGMDKAWRKRVLEWAETSGSAYGTPHSVIRRDSTLASDAATPPFRPHSLPVPHPYGQAQPLPPARSYSAHHPPPNIPTKPIPEIPPPPSFSRPHPAPHIIAIIPFETVKVMDLRFMAHVPNERPGTLTFGQRDILREDWDQFIADASLAWDGKYPRLQMELDPDEPTRIIGRSTPQEVTARLIARWNTHFFLPRGAQAVLCEEHTLDDPASPSHAIYLLNIGAHDDEDDSDTDHDSPTEHEPSAELAERFGSVPEGLERIDVYDPVPDGDHRRGSMRMGKTLIYAGPHAARVHWAPVVDVVEVPHESASDIGSARLGNSDEERPNGSDGQTDRDDAVAGPSSAGAEDVGSALHGDLDEDRPNRSDGQTDRDDAVAGPSSAGAKDVGSTRHGDLDEERSNRSDGQTDRDDAVAGPSSAGAEDEEGDGKKA